MWRPSKAKEQIKRRIIKLLIERQVSTTDTVMNVLREASDSEVADALTELRDEGVLACAGKRWYIRDRTKSVRYNQSS